jgi:3-deoxy-D-manno-octulosonic-acid transferase
VGLPDLTFSVIEKSQGDPLRRLFPAARIEVTGDPRWDRAIRRANGAVEATRSLTERFSRLKRPWAILGSIWLHDLDRLADSLTDIARRYTLWVVPHRVDPQSLAAVRLRLQELGLQPVQSSNQPKEDVDCILVDGVGILAELYSRAQWAYVGGGFGKGVHSLLEPAVYGIPFACGPAGTAEADELIELRRNGQLTVVTSREQFRLWLSSLDESSQRRKEWRTQALAHQGPSRRIVEILAGQIGKADLQ